MRIQVRDSTTSIIFPPTTRQQWKKYFYVTLAISYFFAMAGNLGQGGSDISLRKGGRERKGREEGEDRACLISCFLLFPNNRFVGGRGGRTTHLIHLPIKIETKTEENTHSHSLFGAKEALPSNRHLHAGGWKVASFRKREA